MTNNRSVRRPKSRATGEASRYRVLSLDGGGVWSLIQARALGEIFGTDTPGHQILETFSLAAANSGGSIVLAGLCCNLTPRQIGDMFGNPRIVSKIFRRTFTSYLPALRNVLPRYSATGKRAGLQGMFATSFGPNYSDLTAKKFGDLPKAMGIDIVLLVTSFDYARGRAAFFRATPHHPDIRSTNSQNPSLLDVVHASSNAPAIYFDEPARVEGKLYWDGAMAGYNNPVLAAVVEAQSLWPGHEDEFRVLSIGTGTVLKVQELGVPYPFWAPDSPQGIVADLEHVAKTIIEDPPDVATFHAHMALRQPFQAKSGKRSTAGNIVRMNPSLQPVWDPKLARWDLPRSAFNAAELHRLTELGIDVLADDDIKLIEKLTTEWINGFPNQPIRASSKLLCEIGHTNFKSALDHWQGIK